MIFTLIIVWITRDFTTLLKGVSRGMQNYKIKSMPFVAQSWDSLIFSFKLLRWLTFLVYIHCDRLQIFVLLCFF